MVDSGEEKTDTSNAIVKKLSQHSNEDVEDFDEDCEEYSRLSN